MSGRLLAQLTACVQEAERGVSVLFIAKDESRARNAVALLSLLRPGWKYDGYNFAAPIGHGTVRVSHAKGPFNGNRLGVTEIDAGDA